MNDVSFPEHWNL